MEKVKTKKVKAKSIKVRTNVRTKAVAELLMKAAKCDDMVELKKHLALALNEIQDPFSESIDEFLRDKNSRENEDSPIETQEDDLESETDIDYKTPEETGLAQDPQDVVDDKFDEAMDDKKEVDVENLEEQKEDLDDKIEDLGVKRDEYAESALRVLNDQLVRRGFTKLSRLVQK